MGCAPDHYHNCWLVGGEIQSKYLTQDPKLKKEREIPLGCHWAAPAAVVGWLLVWDRAAGAELRPAVIQLLLLLLGRGVGESAYYRPLSSHRIICKFYTSEEPELTIKQLYCIWCTLRERGCTNNQLRVVQSILASHNVTLLRTNLAAAVATAACQNVEGLWGSNPSVTVQFISAA